MFKIFFWQIKFKIFILIYVLKYLFMLRNGDIIIDKRHSVFIKDFCISPCRDKCNRDDMVLF